MDRRQEILQELEGARADRLAAAMPGRDGAVQSARAQAGGQIEPHLAARLKQAEIAAALSGRFRPDELFADEESEDVRRFVLSELARVCIPPTGEDRRWFLSNARRKAILWLEENRRVVDIRSRRPLPAADDFGAALRKTLRHGSAAKITAKGPAAAGEALRAIDFVRSLGLPAPVPTSLRDTVARDNFLSDYEPLLENDFVGRMRESRDIEEFARRRERKSWSKRWPSLVVSGHGGSGKSTLVARCLRKLARSGDVSIAILDFDRPGVDPFESHLLELEISRQIGYQRPEMEDDLRIARESIRDFRQTLTSESLDGPYLESAQRGLRSFVHDVAAILTSHHCEAKPLLVVLDTMEEVVAEGATRKLTDWLDDLSDALEPIELKIIFSGRLSVAEDGDDAETSDDMPPEIAFRDPQRIELRELPRTAAAKILLGRGVPAADVDILLRGNVVPKRPLELIVLARLFIEEPEMHAQEFVEHMREGGEIARKMFSSIVYKRVLQRLRDPIVQRLAHPGLVLRYIDADIVHEILVPALGLQLDDLQIDRAVSSLAEHHWLARRHPDGSVWHRRDLRRSMLRSMRAEEQEAADAISSRAAKWFASFPDDRMRAESLYHVLMGTAEPERLEHLDLKDVAKLAKHFAPDIADLPRAGRALARYALSMPFPVAEIEWLPPGVRADATDKTGARLVRTREFALAASLVAPAEAAYFRRGGDASRSRRWTTEALFATGRWNELVDTEPVEFPRFRRLTQLADFLIPREIVSPLPISGQEFDGLIDERQIRLDLKAGDIASPAAQLGLGLSLIASRTDLGQRCRGIAQVVHNTPRRHSGVGPRQLLLALLGGTSEAVEVMIRPSQLRLERGWLLSFRDKLNGLGWSEAASALDDTAQVLSTETARADASITKVLAAVDMVEATRRGGGLAFNVVASEWGASEACLLLSGPIAELLDPLRYSLARAFSPDRLPELRSILIEELPWAAEELTSTVFEQAFMTDPQKALLLPMEMIDRLGLSHPLVDRIVASSPFMERELGSIASAYSRVSMATEGTFSNWIARSK